jgi:outer membrane lipoprotein SlyB
VLLQTMPFSRLADRILAAAPRAGGVRREEGLGSIGGGLLGGVIGSMIDRDR